MDFTSCTVNDAPVQNATTISSLPDELASYFTTIEGCAFAGRCEAKMNLLASPEALAQTQTFLAFHPVVRAVGGVVLDDPSTSGHHVYATTSPVRGMVLHLAKDETARVVFESIDAMLASARVAIDRPCTLSYLHASVSPLAEDQTGLSTFLRGRLDENDTATTIALIPSMDLRDLELVRELADHPDPRVATALAQAIARRPSKALAQVARECCTHEDPQVTAAGQRAEKSIAKLR